MHTYRIMLLITVMVTAARGRRSSLHGRPDLEYCLRDRSSDQQATGFHPSW